MTSATIDLGSIITGAVGSLIVFLIGVVLFFLKRIVDKMDTLVTKDDCRTNRDGCKEVRTEQRRTVDDKMASFERTLKKESDR